MGEGTQEERMSSKQKKAAKGAQWRGDGGKACTGSGMTTSESSCLFTG